MAKDYYLINDVQIINCTINDVPQIIKDNETKYVIANFLVDNCVVSLNSSATKTVFDMSKNGFINDLTIKNSTFYSKGIDQDYFVRYSNAAGFEVDIEIVETPLGVRLTFIDDGDAYDPLAHADPDTTLPAAERPIGGLGIFMVKRMASSIAYRRSHGRNILSVVLSA